MNESFGPSYIKKVVSDANSERVRKERSNKDMMTTELNHTIKDFWKKAQVHISNPLLYKDDFEYVLSHRNFNIHSLFVSYLENNKIGYHCILNHAFECKKSICICPRKFIIDKSLWLNNHDIKDINDDIID
jgi:hypothetical protein